MKYKKWNIIDEFADPTSELYAPLMRHGEHPKRSHQVIDEHLKKYKAQFEGKAYVYKGNLLNILKNLFRRGTYHAFTKMDKQSC